LTRPRLGNIFLIVTLISRSTKKLSKILGNIKNATNRPEDMIAKFTKKCYGSEPDRKKATEQAKHFLETLFGSCTDLFYLGPNAALEKHVKAQIAQQIRSDEPVVNAELLPNATASDVQSWDGRIARSESSRGTLWTRKMKHYLIGPTLGVGGTAKVKLGLDTRNNMQEVAVKILKPRYAKDALREIDTLAQLKHKNIIELFDEFANVKFGSKEPTSVFVLEYANKGELIEYLMYTGKFEVKLARWMFHDLVEAVDYIHGKGFAHRDLKHDNCLLGANFMLKITDFGFAAPIGADGKKLMKTAIGTEQYAAPEILRHQEYNKAVDIFAMGVMLFIALAGCQPFMRADSRDRWYSLIVKGDWKAFWQYHITRAHRFKDSSMDILAKMLIHRPKERITIEEIKKHPFFLAQRYAQNDAADILQKRKNKVDKEKWATGDASDVGESRALPTDTPCAPTFWSTEPPPSPFYFYSRHPAKNIQDALQRYIENSVENRGLGGICKPRKVEQEEFDLGQVLLSQGDFESDMEYLANGKPNPYNVKFQVDVDGESSRSVYGIWRIYREYVPDKTGPYMKKKIETIKAADRQKDAAIAEAKRTINPGRELVAAVKEANEERDEAIKRAGFESDTLYFGEKDREALELRNIVVFNPWRTPQQKKGKIKTIKSADGTRLKVRKKSHNKQLFPEVYKMILASVAAGLMVCDEGSSGAKES